MLYRDKVRDTSVFISVTAIGHRAQSTLSGCSVASVARRHLSYTGKRHLPSARQTFVCVCVDREERRSTSWNDGTEISCLFHTSSRHVTANGSDTEQVFLGTALKVFSFAVRSCQEASGCQRDH